mmetsp:Transcript_996/g.3111  ORF Transcript_996/g.3111 Transcript_996/m.3111 type:complete len:96 (+) Transcript_996:457-744(+)
MNIVVRPTAILFNDLKISASVDVSNALVASSHNRIFGFFKRVLAMAILCFSPPDNLRPRSPTSVSYPSAKLRIVSSMEAILAARKTSSSVASTLP